MLTSNLKYLLSSSLILSLLVTTQSHAAAVVDPTSQPFNVLPNHAVSGTDVSSGSEKAYRPWFENATFSGDLIQYDISTSGSLSTDVDFSAIPPTATGSNWSARVQFNAKNSTYWTDTRTIIFNDVDGTQKAFDWANLSSAQQTSVDSVAAGNGDSSSDILDYIRGDQSNETDQAPPGTLRARPSIFGAVIHSTPVYIDAPDAKFILPGYSDFRGKASTDSPISGQSDRAARVYVSANDGMVHAFNAATGDEVWAYIPSMIIGNLKSLSVHGGTQEYLVDGQLAEGDADFGVSPTTEWHSLLVGGLGSGGKGLFALDVTSANLTSDTILWEIDGTDDDMGYIHGKAQIARLPEIHSNAWRVITGNGYSSTSGLAKLLLIDKLGNVTEVSTDDSITSNGLSAVTLVDVDSDFDVDYGYAGDLQGNMWKFDFTTNPIGRSKLFAGSVDKPITSAPDIRIHPSGGRIIYFGTGSLLSGTDSGDTTTQSIYGIWDGAPAGNTTLRSQTLGTDTYTYTSGSYEVTKTVRTSTNDVIDWSTHKGWQVDLNISGERLVTKPIVRANRLQFITHNPSVGNYGDAWLLEFNVLNGGTGPGVFFDLNRDTNLDNDDRTLPIAPATVGEIPIGINLGEGSFSGPTIARVSNDRDTMFINGLFLSLADSCTTDCSGGFQLGHADVDTDSPAGTYDAEDAADQYCYFEGKRPGNPVDSSENEIIPPSTTSPVTRTGSDGRDISSRVADQDEYGNEVDAHVHEYDKAHGQVYIDFVNLEPLCAQQRSTGRNRDRTTDNDTQDLNRITEVNMGNTTKFLAVIANADLSPGSTFTLGGKSWNALVYQVMVQKQFQAWKAAGAVPGQFATYMVDDDGATLLYSIDELIAAGTMRHSFDDRAIADGGLLPTIYSCVTSDAEKNLPAGNGVDKGRWRGGSLLTQIIDADILKNNADVLIEQQPTDLYRKRTIDGTDVWLKADNLDETVDPAVAGTDGVYETIVYGGLRARYRDATSNNVLTGTNKNAYGAFLYEVALYWHYESPGNICYGNASWSANVVGAANSASTPSFKDTIASLEYNLEEIEVAIAKAIADGDDADLIERMRAIKTSLTEKIEDKRSELNPSILEYTGTVTTPTSLDPDVSPSLGPNFRTGRRTWIDLTPQKSLVVSRYILTYDQRLKTYTDQYKFNMD